MDKKLNNAGATVGLDQNSGSSSYGAAIDAISSLITKRRRADGSNKGDNFHIMYEYLKILDLEEPVSQLRIIHVAGTKGKGSTCAFVESILRTYGFRTGLYTSPHLTDVFERYRLDGLEISVEKFLTHFWWCWDRLKGLKAIVNKGNTDQRQYLHGLTFSTSNCPGWDCRNDNCTEDVPMPPYFRFLTLLAFKIFTAEKVDVAILEVGLGGKFDATNVVKAPVVCGISSLGFDHMEILGDTLGQIAGEKAGIFKLGVPAITVPQPEEAMNVLKDKASQLGIPLQVVSPLDSGRLGGMKLGLAGDHQYINAGLAVALCHSWLMRTGHSEDFNLSESAIEEGCLPDPFIKGLATTNIPGRAQVIPDSCARYYEHHNAEEAGDANSGELIFYLDGAHSPESMEACAKWFCHAIREDGQSNMQARQGVFNEVWNGSNGLLPNSNNQYDGTENPGKHSKQILLFNCMSVRDPQLLLSHLVNTCSLHGVHFHRALFVPSQSSYTQVGSSLISSALDPPQVDLSWQLLLQRTWENIIHREKAIEINQKIEPCLPQTQPPREFLLGNSAQGKCPDNSGHPLSAVMPSLPYDNQMAPRVYSAEPFCALTGACDWFFASCWRCIEDVEEVNII